MTWSSKYTGVFFRANNFTLTLTWSGSSRSSATAAGVSIELEMDGRQRVSKFAGQVTKKENTLYA